MKLSLLFLFSAIVLVAYSRKDTLVIYYNAEMKEVKGKEKETAPIYRKYFAENSVWVFNEYNRKNQLIGTGAYTTNKFNIKTGVFTEYNSSGVKISEVNYVNDTSQGDYYKWHDDGAIRISGTYKDGKINGDWESKYANGLSKEKGKIINNRRDGSWTGWYENGQIEYTGTFNTGVETGEWKYMYENGLTKSEGTYVNGKLTGKWTYYFESGSVSAIDSCEGGKVLSTHYWNENGEEVDPKDHPYREASFVGGEMAMQKFIQQNIHYPSFAVESGMSGLVYIRFIIETDGSLSEIEVIISSGFELLDAEALRVVRLMPAWLPEIDHNRPVEIPYVIPISFKITR